jgi:hypothetical protein
MESSPSSVDTQEYVGMMLPWKYAARAKAITCSPVRSGVVICMNAHCQFHDRRTGSGDVGHEFKNVYLASDLEWFVVNSFGTVDPIPCVELPEFHNWTQTELYLACYGTDSISKTRRLLFDDVQMSKKLKLYVSTFDGASSVLSERREAVVEPLRVQTLEETVLEWSNGVEPITFVVLMKKRNDMMMRKISLLRNTVDVWKSEAEKSLCRCRELERKVKFLKKR